MSLKSKPESSGEPLLEVEVVVLAGMRTVK